MAVDSQSVPLQRQLLFLLPLFLLALLPRMYAAMDYGRDWYGPGSFTHINFDEAGSCRAALQGFDYSPLVGWQTLGIARLLGMQSPAAGSAQVKAFCHSEGHLTVARLYSAFTGAATVIALWALAALLLPGTVFVPGLAAGLLALSGWHMSESLMGTVDAPSTFFIYAFMAAGLWAARRGGPRWVLAAVLLLPALGTKYWVFALLSLAVLLPRDLYARCLQGLSPGRMVLLLFAYAALFALVSNTATPGALRLAAPLLLYPLLPLGRMSGAGRLLFLAAPWLAPLAMQLDAFVAFSSGGLEGRFGSDYGAIGEHKWLRNALNLPIVLVMGLGLPAALAAALGVRYLWLRSAPDRAWLVLLPLPAFALYMFFLAPVTYYRHYLPLLPAACLLAALGIAALPGGARSALAAVLLTWQAALALDLVSDYRRDPRRELPAWYADERPRAVLYSYYVNPPPSSTVPQRLFRGPRGAPEAWRLRGVDTLILSENWYDTAFANELNGPLVHDPRRLIKTTPAAVRFYRAALADEHPHLTPVARFHAPTFMPELLLHYRFYGSFTQFVGDIVVLQARR